jgi:hypothetical protein
MCDRNRISLLLLAMGQNLFFSLEPAQLAFLFNSLVQPNLAHQLNPASLTRNDDPMLMHSTRHNQLSLTVHHSAPTSVITHVHPGFTDPSSLWFCPWRKEPIGGDRSKVYPQPDSV